MRLEYGPPRRAGASRYEPSILHAQSDFFNALIASAVGKRYWDSDSLRVPRLLGGVLALAHDHREQVVGYCRKRSFRRTGCRGHTSCGQHAEEVARQLPDHVFTLAEVMREHIIESSQGGVAADAVTIVPNAVEATNFPVQQPDRELAAEIGLPEGAVTVGYISSIVEYEGIDTLIDAFQLASTSGSTPMCLLLVGDGDYLPTCERAGRAQGRGERVLHRPGAT